MTYKINVGKTHDSDDIYFKLSNKLNYLVFII